MSPYLGESPVCESKKPRLSWDEYFREIAKLVSTRSTCPRASVGAILVKDKRIIATGYNGALPGEPHCTVIGCDMQDNHCQRAIHAEVNAIAQAAKFGVSVIGAVFYIYMSRGDIGPCRECRKVISAAGIGVYSCRTDRINLGEIFG